MAYRPPARIIDTSSIKADILNTYINSMDVFLTGKGDVDRLISLRPSQIPFCPIGFFVRHATHGLMRSQGMQSAFYTEVGRSVHSVVQKYLAHSGRFLSSWKCKQCGKKYKLTVQNECCDFPMQYHEVEINFKGIVGHIDAIFVDRFGNYWIVDFKTTSVKGAPLKPKKPGVDYVEQVETYALMMQLQYKIKIKGVMLMFIKRDNPMDPVIWEHVMTKADYTRVRNRTVEYRKQHRLVLSIKTKAAAMALLSYGKCRNPWCSICKSQVPLSKQLLDAYTRGVANKRLPLISLDSK